MRLTHALATMLILAGCGGGGASPPPPPPPPPILLSIDCTASNAGCPPLTINGDPLATLPDGSPSPVRGYADPSMRRDLGGARIWLGYSWVHPALSGGNIVGALVDSHLARSDDGGQTWTKVATLWQATGSQDESGRPGHINTETVSLAPRQVGSSVIWYSARMVYFSAGSVPDVGSFTIHVAAAGAPDELGSAEEGVLGGDRTRPFWAPDFNLASLTQGVPGDELDGCTFYDASIIYRDGRLYLGVQCAHFTQSGQDFVAVFSTEPNGSPRQWSWAYHGKLADGADAIALGGEKLEQTDLAIAQDGTLLAIFSPSASVPGATLSQHLGCKAVEVASLDPARLVREANGALRVRASITASDLTSPNGTPSACGYDAASATGILVGRRDDRQGLRSTLHRTGLRP